MTLQVTTAPKLMILFQTLVLAFSRGERAPAEKVTLSYFPSQAENKADLKSTGYCICTS